MGSGEERISYNYSFGCSTNRPNGCLLNPEGSRLIFFDEGKSSPNNNLQIYTHTFFTNHLGEPAGYQTSERFNIDSAWEKWDQLHQKGWTEVPYEYG
tara:strand:+ start:164 stop:454 length:291 start_codon:yes stop_codon:yes gene_type:complete